MSLRIRKINIRVVVVVRKNSIRNKTKNKTIQYSMHGRLHLVQISKSTKRKVDSKLAKLNYDSNLKSSSSPASRLSPIATSPTMYRNTSLSVIIPSKRPFFPPCFSSAWNPVNNASHRKEWKLTSPSTTTNLCTRRFLMSCRSVPRESEALQITTPGKSVERSFNASLIVRSRDWYAPRRTSV